MLDALPDWLIPTLRLALALAGVTAALWGAHVVFIARHRELGSERLFPRQLALLGLTLAGLVVVALALPVDADTRRDVIGLIGLVISGVIAFSSGTIFANLMGGLMLRVTRPFRTGDFITVQSHFGRVVQRGLLDTEIQTETRELVSLPNTLLITQPVAVVRNDGAIVTTTMSLGYDLHHATIDRLLRQAATDCGLEDSFVRVLELGDDAVTYRIGGVLTDTKHMLKAKSDLNRKVLDTLHGAGIEIVSPRFVNHRALGGGQKVMPTAPARSAEAPVPDRADAIAFDMAEAAAKLESVRQRLLGRIADTEKELAAATAEAKAGLEDRLARDKERLAGLDARPPADRSA